LLLKNQYFFVLPMNERQREREEEEEEEIGVSQATEESEG
jgi:hypothetical protein